jgi:hypothetical protein
VPIDMNPASSWSLARGVATYAFGGSHVIEMQVPVRDIISTPLTGRGAFGEAEILVRNSEEATGTVTAKDGPYW